MSARAAAALSGLRARGELLLLIAASGGLIAGPRAGPAALAACAVLLSVLAGPPRRALACGLVFLAAACFAQLRLEALDDAAGARAMRARAPGALDATLLEAPRAGASRWHAIARSGGVRLLVRARGDPPRWPIGSGIHLHGELRPRGPREAWLRVRHVALVLDARSATLNGTRRRGLAGRIDDVRTRAGAALEERLPRPEAGLLRGMTLGDASSLPAADLAALRAAGLGHIVAASGQNVALLALLANAVAALAGLGLRTRLLAILGLIAFYVPLAGGGPSVQRAGVMGAAAIAATLASRPEARWHALLLASTVTLALDPAAIGDPGWQLSFAATAAIALLAPGFSGALRRRGVPHLIADAAAMTGAATLATAPISAAVFGQVSLAGLAANVLAAPLIAPITWLGMLGAGFAQLWPGAGGLISAAAGPPLACLLGLARGAASLPGAQLRAGAAPVLAVVAVVATGLTLLARGRGSAPIATGAVLRALGALAMAGVAVAALSGVGTHAGGLPPPAPGALRVSFLDIGQGDATLLQAGGDSLLVDSGPPDAPILDELRAAGVTRLSALAATHAQADHLGGADRVIDAMRVGLLIDGRDGVREDEGLQMARAAREHAVRDAPVHAGDRLRLGALVADVLWPPPRPPGAAEGDPNDRAIVMLVRAAGVRVLLTADAESDVLARLDLPPIDVLKVSHHGSADEGLPALLERLRPRVAVIEVGAGNTYGHPVPATVAALRASGARVLRTDRDGRVVLEAAGGRLTLRRGR